jgi:hypothetical protein
MDSISNGYMPISYIYSNRYGEGKTIVPMAGQALYSNFDNVAGIDASGGTAAYGVDSVQVLDAIIGELNEAKQDSSTAVAIPENPGRSETDSLVRSYGADLHDIATAPVRPYGLSSGFALPGALFSVEA